MMSSVISALVFVLLFSQGDAAENCTGIPAELIGMWKYRGDADLVNGKFDINALNMTRTDGDEDGKTFTCVIKDTDTSYIMKDTGDDKKYMCFTYKKISDNALMAYMQPVNVNNDDPEPTESTVFTEFCGENVNKYPKPGSLLYASTLNAVKCPLIGKFEFDKEECDNKTFKLEVCSGEFNTLTYSAPCDPPLKPFINGSMDCLGSWDGEDGLKYAIVKTADIADDDTTWVDKFACLAYKEPNSNNTMMMTAQDFQCGEDQTEMATTVDDGWKETIKKVNTDEECVADTDVAGASTLMSSFISSVLCVVVSLRL